MYSQPLDRIGRHLQKVAPEHLGGYLNGWLNVETYDLQGNHKMTQVFSGVEKLLEIHVFESDRRIIIQVFHNEKIIETTIL